MKVYVWEDVLTDWTSGMIVVVASSDALAVKKLKEMFGDKDDRIEGLVFEGKEPEVVNVRRGDEPQGWYVYGGG